MLINLKYTQYGINVFKIDFGIVKQNMIFNHKLNILILYKTHILHVKFPTWEAPEMIESSNATSQKYKPYCTKLNKTTLTLSIAVTAF